MPSLLTHYEFYKNSKYNLGNIGYLGTQGPDPFFYYGLTITPTIRAKSIIKYGTFLHNVDPYISFKYLVEYIQGSLENEKPVLVAFLSGLFAHYILDKNAHPYIWYISGFTTKLDDNNKKYFRNHTNIESAIDVLVMQKYDDNEKPYEALKFNKHELLIVSKMMYSLARGCYKNKFVKEKSYYKAIKNMIFVQKALYSKSGKKKNFFDKYLSNTPLSSMSQPRIENIKLDFLNLKHNVWCDCITNENPRNTDFFEIFNSALNEYQSSWQEVLKIIDGSKDIKDLANIFKEIDHNGFKTHSVMKYSNCIFNTKN